MTVQWIEVRRPDGTSFRHAYAAGQALPELLPGYEYVGQVLFCDADGKGGIVAPKGRTVMGELLEAYGSELLDWLKAQAVMFGVETEEGASQVLYAKPEPKKAGRK